MTVPVVETIRTSRGLVEAAVVGSGPPVMLVHGTGGTWRQAMPLALDLAGSATVVLPSRPGYGGTPVETGRSHSAQAAAYAAILDELGLGPAIILGISGGGPSAVAFAARRGDVCRGLVLASAVAPALASFGPAALVASVPGAVRLYARREHRRRIAALAEPALSTMYLSRLLTGVERERAAADPELREALVGFLRSTVEGGDGGVGLANDLEQLRGTRARASAEAKLVRVPTLVLHGNPDAIVPASHARHHGRLIAGAELEIVEGAGHLLLLTFRRETSGRIGSFLATVAA